MDIKLSKKFLASIVSLALLTGHSTSNAMPAGEIPVDSVAVHLNNAAGAVVATTTYGEVRNYLAKVCAHMGGLPSLYFDGGGGHGAWRDAFSTAIGQATGGLSSLLYLRHASSGTTYDFTTTAVGVTTSVIYNSCVQGLRFHMQPILAGIFIKRGTFRRASEGATSTVHEQRAKWAAMIIMATATGVFVGTTSPLVVEHVKNAMSSPSTRRLLDTGDAKDLTPSELGDYIARLTTYSGGSIGYSEWNDTLMIGYVPGINTGNFDVKLPTVAFDGFEGEIVVDVQRWGTSEVTKLRLNPSGYHQFPIKVVRDPRGRDWLLSKKEGIGFKVYWRDKTSVNGNWNPGPAGGRLIDLHAGMDNVWGISHDQKIWKCPQPCAGQTWIQQGGAAVSIAVGLDHSGQRKTWVRTINGQYWITPENGRSTWTHVAASTVPVRILDQLNERDTVSELGKSWYYHPEL